MARFGSWLGKGGNYWNGKSGVSHCKLLASLCNAMDLPVTGFGNPMYGGMGTLPGLL